MNRDVLVEIFSYLPAQSLLRFRAVSKFWRDVIDSPSDAVYLQFRLPNDQIRNQLLIELQHNGRSLMSYEFDHLGSSAIPYSSINEQVMLSGPVKGLICIHFECYKSYPDVPIAICNPFLGQLKLLPSASNSSCDIYGHEVSIGFDQDYKVVQMLWCYAHRFLHAQLYCKKTNSWRELAGDNGFPDDLTWVVPITARCKDGYILHWWAGNVSKKRTILSLDMKNEVFRTISLPDWWEVASWEEIFAEDDHSFVFIVLSNVLTGMQGNISAKIYELRCEGSELSWNHVMDAEVPFFQNVPQLRAGCVVLVDPNDMRMTQSVVYDYRARKFIGWYYMEPTVARVVEYRGSLFSP